MGCPCNPALVHNNMTSYRENRNTEHLRIPVIDEEIGK